MQFLAYLSDIVEVPVRHLLLAGTLAHLIEQSVQLVLGLQVVQAPETERLPGFIARNIY